MYTTHLFGDIYRNKKVLVTGNTGFKGSWLSVWLLKLGAQVYGLSDGIPTQPSHFAAGALKERITYVEKDIRSPDDVKNVIEKIRPDFVFHLAAQSLVRVSYTDPAGTVETNVIGTLNVLEALRQVNHPCRAVMITSDKCYDNVEWIWGYRETDALGGKDPYSASKGAAELLIRTYANSFYNKEESNVKVSSVRAGNVIGGGDWAKDRIVPDCIKAWSEGKPVIVRNLNATRPWQHVLEPLSGYLRVGQKLSEDPGLNGEPFNFGPPADQNYSVGELIKQMQKSWLGTRVEVLREDKDVKEATLLKLCCDKALHILGWKANMNFQETVKLTVDWYKTYYDKKKDVFNMTCGQIDDYVRMAQERNLVWVTND